MRLYKLKVLPLSLATGHQPWVIIAYCNYIQPTIQQHEHRPSQPVLLQLAAPCSEKTPGSCQVATTHHRARRPCSVVLRCFPELLRSRCGGERDRRKMKWKEKVPWMNKSAKSKLAGFYTGRDHKQKTTHALTVF